MSFIGKLLVLTYLVFMSLGEDFDATDLNGITETTVNGIFFNIAPKRRVRITTFTITKGGNPSTHNVSVYILKFTGGYQGYEFNRSAWELYHQFQFNSTLIGLTHDIGTFDIPFMINTDEIASFYIVFPKGGSISVTNDNTRGVVESNDMRLYTGTGVNSILNQDPFTMTLRNNRNFIGIVTYNDIRCDGFVTVTGDGGYTLRTKRNGNGRVDRIQCFKLVDDYTCVNPYIDVIYASIDYDQPENDEYLEITSNYLNGNETERDNIICSDSDSLPNECDTYLTCLNRHQDGRILYNNRTFMVRFRNGNGNNEQHCSYNEVSKQFEDNVGMDIYMTLTCGCDAYIEADGIGEFITNVVVEGSTGGGVYRDICFNIDNSFTCHEPNITVIYEDIDYDPNDPNKYLNVEYSYDNITIDLGDLQGTSSIRQCGSHITGINKYYLGPTLDRMDHSYKLRLTNGPNAGNDQYCFENITDDDGNFIGFNSWTMNVSVILSCTVPTSAPTHEPTRSPVNITSNANTKYKMSFTNSMMYTGILGWLLY